MEENVEVRIDVPYKDVVLDEFILQNTRRWVSEKRAKELLDKGVAHIIQIKKKESANNDRQ